jgi:predicted DNA-binding transcriptional regulator YafY
VSKLERLLKLLAVLLDTTLPLSAEDLRQRIGGYPENQASFRRTFERDKNDLRSMGVTIRVSSVPATEPPLDGYIVDRDDYAGQDPGLAPDELAALHLAAALVRVDTLGDDAFWKLGGSGGSAAPETRSGASQMGTVSTSEDAGILHSAISDRRVATFRYRDVERALEPARLSFTRGQWYVSGHDRTRGAERVFRIDRIDGKIVLGSAGEYERRPARGPEVTRTWELGDEEPVAARVRIDAEEALWARVHLRADEIEIASDGSVVVDLTVRNTDAFRDWVLGFLDNAEVLEPLALREVITDWLNEMIAHRGAT